jgi:hypothetical protein
VTEFGLGAAQASLNEAEQLAPHFLAATSFLSKIYALIKTRQLPVHECQCTVPLTTTLRQTCDGSSTAFSLAGSVVQFVDFGSKVLTRSHKLYKSARKSLSFIEELDYVTVDIQKLVIKLQHPLAV